MTAKAYLLKIRGGVEVDSKGQKAGKGPLIAEEISNTLGTSQDQYLFQPVDKLVLDDQGGAVIRWRWDGKSPCLRAQMDGHPPVVIRPVAYGVVTKGNGDAFISKEKHTSLSTGGGQAGQGYPCVVIMPIAFDGYNQSVTGDVTTTLRAGMSNCSADTVPCVVLESHPNDSRVKIDDSGSIQTLTSRMGTGGGNVPMVMMPYSKSRRAKSAEDFETWKESRVSNTINTFDQGDVRATDVVVCIQGNVIDRSDNAGANGAGWRLNQCYTLNTIDRPAVAYRNVGGCCLVTSKASYHMNASKNLAETLVASDWKDPPILYIDRAAFNQGENAKYDFSIDGGIAQTIIARGPGAVCYRRQSEHSVHATGRESETNT